MEGSNKRIGELVKEKDFREKLELYRVIISGKYRMVDPNPPSDFVEYLMRLDYNGWFWTVITWTLVTIILAQLNGGVILNGIKLFLSSIYLLFIIGYVTLRLIPNYTKKLSSIEELGLSIGLSLSIVPLLALILDLTGMGIKLVGITLITSLYVIIVSLTAAIRNYSEFKK